MHNLRHDSMSGGVGLSTGTKARDRVFELVDGAIADPAAGEAAIRSARASLPPEVLGDLDSVLADRRICYRVGVLIQLGHGVVDPALDLTLRPEGARGMVQQLRVFLADRHIIAVTDADQNIAKNTDRLARGNVPELTACSTGRRVRGCPSGRRRWGSPLPPLRPRPTLSSRCQSSTGAR